MLTHGCVISQRPPALDFREWLGGEHKINEYIRKLAMEGGKHLARRLGTELLDPEGHMTLNMVWLLYHPWLHMGEFC